MKKRRLVLLGIDGMDFEYTNSILNKLPNIRRMLDEGLVKPFKSVFPPDSIPAWITAYTGKDPSEHGILESVNYLSKGSDQLKVDTSSFKGQTFWDCLSNKDKEVCIINPFLAYPVWSVKGVMVNGPVFITGDQQVSDPEYIKGVRVPNSFGGITDLPSKKNIGEFCEKIIKDTKDQMEFGINLLKKNDPDLFFQVFLTMDRIQHFLWRYCDKNDPTYPGRNPYENVIEEFYIYIDKLIGKFLEVMGPNDRLIVISDHGHGMRCTMCFNINEYLRRKGLVFSTAKGRISRKYIIEKLKNSAMAFMSACDLEDYMQKVGRLIPNASKIKKGQHITENNKNIAYISDFTGKNPFGGIVINKKFVDDYEIFRAKLISDLKEIKYEGKPVFRWIKNREQIYTGKLLKKFPDILFGMDTKLGIGFNLHTKLFTKNFTHKKISGGHKEYGVIFMNNYDGQMTRDENLKILNLFPTIMKYFGIEYKNICKGESFLPDFKEV